MRLVLRLVFPVLLKNLNLFGKKKTRILEVLHGVYREVSQSLVKTSLASETGS